MFKKLKEFNRTQLILGIVILSTIPCYCLGLIMLWNADLLREQRKATATFTPQKTMQTTLTPSYTIPVQLPTATHTPTLTTTFTPTITYVIPPTRTFTASPSPLPTDTPEPSPTFTDTPVPSLTSTPTTASTETPSDVIDPESTP